MFADLPPSVFVLGTCDEFGDEPFTLWWGHRARAPQICAEAQSVRTYRPIQTFCCGPRKALTRRGRDPGRSNLNTRWHWGLHRDDTEVSGGESSPSRTLGEEVETWFAPGSRGSVVVPYRVRCWETSQVRVQQDPVDVEHLALLARYNGHAGAPRSVVHGRRRPGQGKSLPG